MDNNFWLRLHGASTHFPIVLFAISVLFDSLGIFLPDKSKRSGLRSAGFFCALIALLASIVAVTSGLVISGGKIWGSGTLLRHHQFVWPALALTFGLVSWRVLLRDQIGKSGFAIYLGGMTVSSALIFVAAYFGGELALNGNTSSLAAAIAVPRPANDSKQIAAGRHLFLMNCAHCHGDDATGDEGPDLHGLHKTDARLNAIIRNGIKGEMPRFEKKFNEEDVAALIAYLKSLRT